MDYEVTVKEQIIRVPHIELSGKLYNYNDILEILEELQDTSYIGNHIVIYDGSLREVLENYGVIKTTIKGSSIRGDKYKEFLEKIDSIKWVESE